ncbi:ribonuclease P protein component [Brevibacillus ginsengisoli]|uniref:ribonuclease P protein component n=1 Tax=Brevibacillus ginsengisoli TaxID=363854 RepID=UPI003CFA0CFF
MHHSHRLKKNEEFQVVFQQGKSSANKQFVVYVLPKKDQNKFRVGISVSKKIGNAVARNRVKRLIREALTDLEDQIMKSIDFVIIARPATIEMTLDMYKSSLAHVMKRASILKPKEIHKLYKDEG